MDKKDLDRDWYTYLFEDFKLDRKMYKTADYAVFDCPKCEKVASVQIAHVKAKIKALGYYECSKCRKRASIERARQACKEKYGDKYPAQLKEVKEKIKKTNLERYGVDCVLKKPEIHEKGIKAAASPDSRKKAKKTLKKNYGVDHPLELNRKKVDKALIEKAKNLKKNTLPKILKLLETDPTSISNPEFYKQLKVSYTTIIKWLREEGYSHYIKDHTIEDQFNKSLEEVGQDIANYVETNKIPALVEDVETHFNLSRPSLKKCLIAAGKEDLIGKYKSYKEHELFTFVKSLGFETHRNTRKIITPLELDIYLPSEKLAIEFNGLYWHSENFLEKTKHQDKLRKCNEKRLDLIQVFEDEWDFKKEIVKSIIRSKLNLRDHKVYSWRCEIKEVNPKTRSSFLEENHLQGDCKGKSIGLYYKGNLLSLITYRKSKKGISISRFCSKLNYQIPGAFSKLWKYIEEFENPEFLQIYRDLRYENNELLTELGFKLEKISIGWKWTDFNHTYDKLPDKKSVHELGWVKIYDAGQAKWIKKLK